MGREAGLAAAKDTAGAKQRPPSGVLGNSGRFNVEVAADDVREGPGFQGSRKRNKHRQRSLRGSGDTIHTSQHYGAELRAPEGANQATVGRNIVNRLCRDEVEAGPPEPGNTSGAASTARGGSIRGDLGSMKSRPPALPLAEKPGGRQLLSQQLSLGDKDDVGIREVILEQSYTKTRPGCGISGRDD